MYKLTFMASDSTAKMRMFCVDAGAKGIVGKIMHISSHLISYRHATYSPDLASIVSLKITSIVVYNQISCVDLDKEHLIKSVISSHGRDVPLTSPGLNIPQIFHYIHQLQQNYYLDQNNQFRLLQQYRNSQQAFLQV